MGVFIKIKNMKSYNQWLADNQKTASEETLEAYTKLAMNLARDQVHDMEHSGNPLFQSMSERSPLLNE